MKAEELHLAQLYVDGELGEDQVTDLLHRIEADPDLKKHVEQLKMVENLAGSLEVYRAPSVDFTAHPATADLSRSSMASLPVARPPVTRISMSSFLAGAAAAAACILLGFGLAGQIISPRAPVETATIFRVVYYSSNARSVSVLGDFNGWSSEIPLRAGNGGYWETEVQVPPGEYRYVFVVDGQQHVPDPTADYVIDDDFGSKNSVVRIGL